LVLENISRENTGLFLLQGIVHLHSANPSWKRGSILYLKPYDYNRIPPQGTPLKSGTWHTQNLVAFWNFQDGTGTTLTDIYGSNHATLYNFSSPPTTTSGWNIEDGYVLSFNGSNNYCSGSTLVINDPITISFWFKFNSYSGNQHIFTNNAGSTSGFQVYSANGFIYAKVGTGTLVAITGQLSLMYGVISP
jgi:hypothetical protein